ncbi:fungal trichothecene efflux pump [Aspergillus navahoensis]
MWNEKTSKNPASQESPTHDAPNAIGERQEVANSRHSVTWWIAVSTIAFLYSFSIGLYMLVVTLTGIINEDIGSHESYLWIAPAWSVSAGAMTAVTGALSDVLGRRWFCIGTGLFGILGCILGAVAQNVPTVVAALVMLGTGKAGAVTSMAAAAELVSRRQRSYILAMMNAPVILWLIGGAYFGRRLALETGPGWRSVFWLGLAGNCTGTILIFLTYHPNTALAVTKKAIVYEKWQDFDWLGLFGILSGPTLFLVGILNINKYGADNPRFIAPFLSGILVLVALVIWEGFFSRMPLLHPFLFRRVRTFTLILVVAFVGGMLFYALQAFFHVYIQELFTRDPVEVAINLMPMNAAINSGSVISGLLLPWLAPRVGTNSILAFAVGLQLLFIPLLCLANAGRRAMALAFSALGGIGVGIVETNTVLLVQLASPDEWIGFATGSAGLMRSLGGSVGTAVYTTIHNTNSARLVPEYITDTVRPRGLSQDAITELLGFLQGTATGNPLSDIPGVTSEILELATDAMKRAYNRAFRDVWLTSIAFGVIALACALFSKDLSPQMTSHVAQHLRNEEPNPQSDSEKGETQPEGRSVHIENPNSPR